MYATGRLAILAPYLYMYAAGRPTMLAPFLPQFFSDKSAASLQSNTQDFPPTFLRSEKFQTPKPVITLASTVYFAVLRTVVTRSVPYRLRLLKPLLCTVCFINRRRYFATVLSIACYCLTSCHIIAAGWRHEVQVIFLSDQKSERLMIDAADQ